MAVIDKTGEAVPQGQFAATNCIFLDFRFRLARDKFKLAEFSADMNSKGMTELLPRWTVTCLPQFPTETDYHVHFAWTELGEKDLELWVSYHSGSIRPRSDEKEPYAEQVMNWLGQFFVGGHANAQVQCRIDYPVSLRRTRYLLPIRVGIVPDVDTVINGISIDFPSKPNGIDTARLTVGAKNVALVLSGVVKLSFDTFNIFEQLVNFSGLALSLTELRKPS